LQSLTHLPVIVDPSHGVGLREFIPTMAKAAVAIHADGLMVEVHTDPEKFHGQGSLVDYSPWGCKESDMTEHIHWS